MMRHFFRPSILIALSAAVVVGAVVVVFQGPPSQGRPTPLPVAPGELEIVWLYTATNAPSWERFVTAVRRTAERLQRDHPGLQADVNAAFPRQTTAVPEVTLFCPGSGPRFVFRWYKLTSDWKTRDWIAALLKRRPPPLAIIGGSSSDSARELAAYLNQFARELPESDRPLLLLTTATADRVIPYAESRETSVSQDEIVDPAILSRPAEKTEEADSSSGVKLTRLYPGRTFRFCFTNKQMANAVTDFIWWQDDLRPDNDPVYMVKWDDDSYSRDLIGAFWEALHLLVVKSMANQWAWISGSVASGIWPPLYRGGIFPAERLPLNPFKTAESGSLFCLAVPPTPQVIDSSVGAFATPNRYEAKVARDLLDLLLDQQKPQKRPLLILTGQSQPSRRFLRALIRSVPDLAGRFVVAAGDTVSFNIVYRDGQTAWNIQDLPFPLVFFCHRNPIDPDAGFRSNIEQEGKTELDDPNGTAATGTEDVLLFGDMVEALLQAGAPAEGPPCSSAEELSQRLASVRLLNDRIVLGREGVHLFGRDGQRQSGTGEHVVCLRPSFNEDFRDRLLPEAAIEVWAWQRRDRSRGERGQHWQRRGKPLNVSYCETPREGGRPHGGP
jgi:hypothetical protein